MRRQRPTRTFERLFWRVGFARVAGVDEVGRGCLAGPVVAAAVVLDGRRRIPGLRDSKMLTADQRERSYDLICVRAAAWAVGEASVDEIDRVNIYRASLIAMRRAVMALLPLPDALLVDAVRVPDVPMAQRALVHGDARVASIAAASIVAKVTRDKLMQDLHVRDGRYGFDKHKGYGTPDHLRAVASHGLSPAHRRTFRVPTLFDTVES